MVVFWIYRACLTTSEIIGSGSANGQIQLRGARRPQRSVTSVMNHNSNIQRINVIVLVCKVSMSIVAYILFHIEERIQRKIAEI